MAKKLRGEADQLNHRVEVTEMSIQNLEASSNMDDKLVESTKRKVRLFHFYLKS